MLSHATSTGQNAGKNLPLMQHPPARMPAGIGLAIPNQGTNWLGYTKPRTGACFVQPTETPEVSTGGCHQMSTQLPSWLHQRQLCAGEKEEDGERDEEIERQRGREG